MAKKKKCTLLTSVIFCEMIVGRLKILSNENELPCSALGPR